jgi:hypothetical protein
MKIRITHTKQSFFLRVAIANLDVVQPSESGYRSSHARRVMLDSDTTRDVQVDVGEHSIVLKQQLDEDQLAPIFDDEWTASMVWEASYVLSCFLDRGVKDIWQPGGKSVIELGSGW